MAKRFSLENNVAQKVTVPDWSFVSDAATVERLQKLADIVHQNGEIKKPVTVSEMLYAVK